MNRFAVALPNFSTRHVLVTGASGLLGSGVASALVAAGAQLTTLQRRRSGIAGAYDVLGSITDPELVARAVQGVDTIIHVAAKVSVSGPAEAYRNVNIQGTGNLLDAAHRAGTVNRWIHISSPSVAHAGRSLVGTTAQPADPDQARGHYAATKATGERLVLAADREDFRVLVLRPHLMWGPGDTQLTERIIDRARSHRMPILSSGAPLIDTLFIDNAISAVLAAVSAIENHHGEALVVTNGEPRPVGELIRQIAIAGGTAEPTLRLPAGLATVAGAVIEKIWDLTGEHDDEPPLTRFLAEQLSTAHWFDQRRTREVLAWKPEISIDRGLELTADYYGNH